MKHLAIFFLILGYSSAIAQKDFSIQYAETITSTDLEEHLAILASDALEGRETGERGQKMAAEYIKYFFNENDLQPIVETSVGKSYLQSFELVRSQVSEAFIEVNGVKYDQFVDFAYLGKESIESSVKSELVFVGQGSASDFEEVDVSGKNVLIYNEGGRTAMMTKVREAIENNAKTTFIIQAGDEESNANTFRMFKNYISNGRLSLPKEKDENNFFLISQKLGLEILSTDVQELKKAIEKTESGNYDPLKKLITKEIEYYSKPKSKKIFSENVLGFIEGSDLKDDVLVLTAHYDHIGKSGDKVNNGADDDGSGTVAVMEIAQAFAEAKKNGHGPRRSILFMTVTGEEKGLLGSTYYVNNPVLPLENTVANLNIDMIGRVDKNHETNPEYVYLIGSDKLSSTLHQVSENANQTYSKLELDYTYNDENDPNRFYYRSDHYNFAKNNIPVIFYFNGTHEDYHKPTDTIEKIEFDILTKRTRLIFHTCWEIANREERIVVDVQKIE